ncbi:hypothetical protein MMC13_000001 [Lambiella insularis]|nr:hypothetical protein [Lambiella insularis]
MSFPGKIDVHHHALPGFYCEAVAKSQVGDLSGAPAPVTTIQGSLELMDDLNIATSIISLSAPGAEVAESTEGARALARRYNEYALDFRHTNPSRLGFFAALPGLNDKDGCMAELKYAMDKKADGITLFTSYGEKYLGHPDFEYIWAELNKYKAVVFVHPTHTASGKWASPQLQQPTLDYPHETTRTAADMIMSGRKRQYQDCKIILSHGGGTLPFLAERLKTLSSTLFLGSQIKGAPLNEEIIEDAKSFYFDTALSGTANFLDSFLKWAPKDRILFGSDFPYAPNNVIAYMTHSLEKYEMDDSLRENIYEKNGQALFPRLRKWI